MQKRALTLFSVAAAITAVANYPINYPIDTTIVTSDSGKGTRYVSAIKLTSASTATQSIECSQQTDRLLYHDRTDHVFVAPIGEALTASFDFNGTWMHGYVYIDLNKNGEFDIPSEAVAYSNYDSYNSVGTATNNGDVGVNPPSFTIPATTAPGTYTMRYKVDWNSLDPGGNTQEGSTITENGGAITDATLYLYDPSSLGLTIDNVKNGTITAARTGTKLTVTATPDAGYVLESLTATSGFNIDIAGKSFTLADSSFQSNTVTIPAYLFTSEKYYIPLSSLPGDITVTASFVKATEDDGTGVYPCSLSGTKAENEGFASLRVNTVYKSVASTNRYFYAMSAMFGAVPGGSVSVVPKYSGNASKMRLYIDWNNDGQFAATDGTYSNELVAEAATDASFPTVKVPSDLPLGVYRARVEAEDDCAVDFLLNVHTTEGTLNAQAMNGLILTADDAALPNTIPYNKLYSVKVQPCVDGYAASSIIVRHGQNLSGPTYVNGNPQWADNTYTISSTGVVNIPASAINGDVTIYVIYEEQPSSEWTKVWSDEFNGTSLDTNRWRYRSRGSSTWARFIAETSQERAYVNKVKNGSYNAYAIATPSVFTEETQEMISGAVESDGLFSTQRGRIEGRMRTRPHTGNFPAFWMMPVDGSLGWPACGEIDIWEAIDTKDITYGTVHTGWSYLTYGGSPSQSSPSTSGNTYADQNLWHVYAIEWDDEQIRWYVDGRQYHTYTNQHFSEGDYTTAVTWPYDKEFYIIINQSVGNGSWAANRDTEFEYQTEFDYVRVYKKKGDTAYTSKVKDNGENDSFYTPADQYEDPNASISEVNASATDAPATYYDLNGRPVDRASMRPGIYVERRGSSANKILIK
jgi:beta-glucanase (GH16 family)